VVLRVLFPFRRFDLPLCGSQAHKNSLINQSGGAMIASIRGSPRFENHWKR
jgi:hypothetical protein